MNLRANKAKMMRRMKIKKKMIKSAKIMEAKGKK